MNIERIDNALQTLENEECYLLIYPTKSFRPRKTPDFSKGCMSDSMNEQYEYNIYVTKDKKDYSERDCFNSTEMSEDQNKRLESYLKQLKVK